MFFKDHPSFLQSQSLLPCLGDVPSLFKSRLFKGNLLPLIYCQEQALLTPEKGDFCAFHSHFLPDSLFQVTARRAVCLVRVAGPEQVQPSLEGAVAFTGADSQDLGVEVEKVSDVGAA